MPTENRSSNTERVSVPEGFMLVERSIWTEQQVEAATACITRLKDVPGMRDCDLAMAAIDAAQCKAPDIALSDLLPGQQPHPEPIAWMVGTAFWWTKEEAEKDAAETGLPIVGLGPMAGVAPAEQHQGEPVAWLNTTTGAVTTSPVQVMDWDDESEPVQALYTHTDPAEVEQLREELDLITISFDRNFDAAQEAKAERDTLRAQLAEAHALLREGSYWLKRERWADFDDAICKKIDADLSASAEPSAPVVQIPEGYCVMPRRLTAENGAKALLLGEFKLETTHECPECAELEEPTEGCEICDGAGEYGQRHMIPWDQIKFIYSEAVKGLALKQ